MECSVTRQNFKDLRMKNNIKLEEIADICNLAISTVNNFEKSTGKYTETNARDYNADMMCQTLESLIKRKEREEAKQKVEPDIPKTEEVNLRSKKDQEKHGIKMSNILKIDLKNRIKNYCEENDIYLVDFMSMCGLSYGTLSPSAAKISPYVSEMVIRKICRATGWTEEQLRTGEFTKTRKELQKEMWIPAKSESEEFGAKIEPKTEPEKKDIPVYKTTENQRDYKMSVEERNRKFIFDGSPYYVEYEVVRHVKQVVTKEEFLAGVMKEDK